MERSFRRMVQRFAHRDAPMMLAVAQKFLRILDMLIDIGPAKCGASAR